MRINALKNVRHLHFDSTAVSVLESDHVTEASQQKWLENLLCQGNCVIGNGVWLGVCF